MEKVNYSLIIIIILLIFQEATAQNFFPLSLGNKYQFEEDWTPSCTLPYVKDYYSTQISDTMVYNNEVYYKYKTNYFLFDSLQQKLFIYLSGKALAVDFTLPSGTEFTSFIQGQSLTFTSGGTTYRQILGENRLCWDMVYQSNVPPYYHRYEYSFADGIGEYDYYWEEECYWYDHHYIAAIIDSTVYNQMNLSLQLTSPIHNIHLNELPLNISVNINMPVIQLLDSLYLDYQVFRDSEVIYDNKVNFDRTSYFAEINPPGSLLAVGDKIKISIIATDYTIFNNRVVLPSDSTFYEIQILPDQISLELYPLAVGNNWIYDGVFSDQSENYTYKYIRQIDSIMYKPNGEQYYKIAESNSNSGAQLIYYERLDSLSGKIFRYSTDSIQSNYEYLVDNLNAQQGDTIMSYRFPTNNPYTVENSGDTTLFQVPCHFKEYDSNYLLEYNYILAQNFGLISVYNYFDFGSDTKILKGTVINGNVYGDTTTTGIEDNPNKINSFSLSQNYPNPFNPTTNIEYQIPGREFVMLKVYDVLGNEVTTLVNEEKPAGSYSVKLDGKNLTSGIYFYQLKTRNYMITKKCILLK